MKTGPLYLKLRNCRHRIAVLQGGGDAGKTVTALQHLAMAAVENRKEIITVSGQTIPSVKAGALRAFQLYVLPDFEKYVASYNETERVYKFHTGSIMEFKSYKDELAAQGSERHRLFMNEANHETFQTFWQLYRKTRKQVILDYNPVSPFWCHSELLHAPLGSQFYGKVQLWIVDHRHNPFLEDWLHDEYESISDSELFRVYSRGMTGKLKGLIFGHFKKWIHDWPTDHQRTIWGTDYGYTNDPTVLMKIAVGPGRRRIGKQCCYSPGISAESLKETFILNGGNMNDIWYSELDRDMINQLRLLGLPVVPAIKGPNSKIAGISKVKEHECFYTSDSLDFEREIFSYKWTVAQDIITGREVMTNIPVDGNDHACDAFMYADYTDHFRGE